MKRLVVSAAALSLLTVPVASSYAGTADGQGAQKRPLSGVTTEVEEQCESSASEDADVNGVFGFAILNAPGKVGAVKKIVGEVALKKAVPNQTYMVFLATDGVCEMTGLLTTNGQGNGNSHIDSNKSDIAVPGTAGTYYVVLRDIAGDERYASSPVALK